MIFYTLKEVIMDVKSATKTAIIFCKNKIPVMFRGPHGIGKSEIVYQIAQELELPVVERRASQMTEGDLLGLPDRGEGGVTKFLPPEWYQRACDEPVLLFFDEIDRSIVQVAQGIFEITDSRKIFGNKLHPETVIMAAVNSGVDTFSYQTRTMDPAELDRWGVIDITPSVDEWLDWAESSEVDPMVVSFIRSNPTSLEHYDSNFEPNKVYPSRRSWVRLSNMIKGIDYTTKEGLSVLQNVALAMVGQDTAISFRRYIEDISINLNEMLSDDAVLKKAIEAPFEIKIDLINQVRVGRVRPENPLEVTLGKEEVGRLIKFMDSLEDEQVFALIRSIGVGNRIFIKECGYNIDDKFVELTQKSGLKMEE